MTSEQGSAIRPDMALTGATDLKMAAQAQLELNNFIATMMRDKVDYGMIPGTNRKSLYQPGAQKLLYFNGLGARVACTEKVQEWDKGFFHYEFKATIFHKGTGKDIAECVGSANSREDRYAWRWVSKSRIPRGMNEAELESKDKDGRNGPYKVYRIPNPEVYTLPNTLMKMAQKRALIGASLLACRASENFTQDVEEEDALEKRGVKDAKDVAPKGTASAKPPESTDKTIISEPQRKRLMAIKNKNNVDDKDLKSMLFEKYDYLFDAEGKVHLSKIKRTDYEAICNWCEAQNAQSQTAGEAYEPGADG